MSLFQEFSFALSLYKQYSQRPWNLSQSCWLYYFGDTGVMTLLPAAIINQVCLPATVAYTVPPLVPGSWKIQSLPTYAIGLWKYVPRNCQLRYPVKNAEFYSLNRHKTWHQAVLWVKCKFPKYAYAGEPAKPFRVPRRSTSVVLWLPANQAGCNSSASVRKPLLLLKLHPIIVCLSS